MESIVRIVTAHRRAIVIDLFFVLAIVFLPSLSHLFAFPLYRLEPMRLLLILALPFAARGNSYLLALILPLVSLITSGHPLPAKALLMTAELLLNVWLFWWLADRLGNRFGAMLGAIAGSKLCYYGAKLLLIQAAVLGPPLVGTALWIQGVLALIFSLYIFIIFSRPGTLPADTPMAES